MIVNINMRDELNEFIRDYGIYVLHQINSKYIRCTCVDPLYGYGDVNCDICNGSGKKIKIVKIKILSEELYPFNRANKIKYSQAGKVYSPSCNFYFNGTYNNVAVRDIIYIVGWDKYGKPINIKNVYEIEMVEAFRGDYGRIEFNLINAANRPELINNGQKIINRLRGKI